MDKPIGTYSFLSYLRVGLANRITQPDGDPVKLRATFDVQLSLEGQSVSGAPALQEPIQQPVELYGPGDIIGIDRRAIFKTDPHDWITNFEPNYLPYIDFYDEDFPWRYTPSRADEPQHRLTPWISLVVLEEGEFDDGKNLQDKPLPYITAKDVANTFPAGDQLWAWAHVHVNRDLAGSDEEMASENMDAVLPKFDATLKENRDFAYSRLMCPRRLKPNTAYHAFLVPTFETGRKAGLGEAVESDRATARAWGAGQTEFPYYHRWYFRTSTQGDFEYLVRLLKAKPANEKVGRRDMDMQQPGWNLPGFDPDDDLHGILRLGGALRVPESVIKDLAEYQKYEDWAKVGYPKPIQSALAKFLNLADDYQKPGANPQPVPDPENPLDPDPLITPPLYGRWHAAVERLLTAADGTPLPNDRNWIHELNLDPRFRVSAGYGTRVVQKNQEEYMNVAWQQVGDLHKVNSYIRRVQFAGETMWQWYAKSLAPLRDAQPDKLLMLSAPVQKRILVQNATVSHHFKTGLVPPVVLSAQMRRITRPRSRVITRLPFAAKNAVPQAMITRLNSGQLLPAPKKPLPVAINNESVLAAQLQPPPQPEWLADLLRRYAWLPTATLIAAIVVLLLALLLGGALLLVAGVAVSAGLVWLYRRMKQIQRQLAEPQVFKDGAQTPEMVDRAPLSPDFRVSTPDDGFKPQTGSSDSAEAVRMKSALKDLYAVDVAARAAEFQPPRKQLDLRLLANETVAALNPGRTLPRLVLDRILVPGRFQKNPAFEQIQEIMNYPQFDLPMYAPLVDLSKEYFLPNVNLIEPNSITLLKTNQKFIESYMVGLNHEMARELLWREYPTDQRGSYFRQFWDVSGYLPETGEDVTDLKDQMRDIPELHTWKSEELLGDHDYREMKGTHKEEVVLVIRGELLKRYPTAVVYAHRARWQTKNGKIDNTVERELEPIPDGLEDKPPRTIVKTPLYSAKIEPDIYFFGFDLDEDTAKGSDGSHPGDESKPGWFFVIKERPGEPRFGLDIGGPNAVKHSWNDLAWEDVTPAAPEGKFLQISGATLDIGLTAPTDATQAEFEAEKQQFKEDNKIAWNKNMDAAGLAYVLFQVPVMVAVHAGEMLTIRPES